MPGEIISLLSSSPDPKSRQLPKSAINKKDPPAHTTSYQEPSRNIASSNDCFEISSDEDTLPTLKSLKHTRAATRTQKPTIASNKADTPPLPLSDDEPYVLPTLATKNPPNLSSLKPKGSSPLKRDHDFYFLSDDFDSSIDLDKSINVGNQPPAKKARGEVSAATMAGLAAQKRFDQNNISRQQAFANERPHPSAEKSSRIIDAPGSKFARTKGTGKTADADPISFTSSPDPYMEAARKRAAKRNGDSVPSRIAKFDVLPDLSSDSILPSDIEPLSFTSMSKRISASTEWEKYEAEREEAKKPKMARKASSGKTTSGVAEGKEDRPAKKEQKHLKNDEKAKEKEEKAKEKEEKARGKERAAELAKVNTLRTDKKISAPEMIVELPSSLDSKTRFQTEALLEGLKIKHRSWDSQQPIVRFRRKVNAEYKDEIGLWEPVPAYIKKEKHIIYFMTGQEFVNHITNPEDNDLDIFILQLKARYEGYQIIFLIQGYHLFIRKNRNLKNRQFAQAVRAAGSTPDEEEAVPTASQRRKKKKEPEYINEDILEDAMFSLQTIHELLVHHTSVQHETAEQIAVFTQQISTIPYKALAQSSSSTFCMESGQVKTGDGPDDTYVKMLQEIVRLTAPIAYGIKEKYPTLGALIEGCLKEGPGVVEECRKSANKDGAFTDRKVGQAISKRVWKVFTGRDVNSLDV